MKMTNTPLPCDSIYGEMARFVENDIVDFDVIKGTKIILECDHYDLKLIAKELLEKRGFVVDAPKGELEGMFDVIAKKGEYEVNVEVGNTPVGRIWANLNRFNEVWWIPYDTGKYSVFIFKRGKNYLHYWNFVDGYSDIMVICPKCGVPSFHTANFCNHCGANLQPILAKYCKTCGRLLPPAQGAKKNTSPSKP